MFPFGEWKAWCCMVVCFSIQLANAIAFPLAEGWLWSWDKHFFTTDSINIFCFHWRVEGLVRHCCASHIRWQTKELSNWCTCICPTTLACIKHRWSFSNYTGKSCTFNVVALVMGQRWSPNKTQHQHILCPLDSNRLGIAFSLPPIHAAYNIAFPNVTQKNFVLQPLPSIRRWIFFNYIVNKANTNVWSWPWNKMASLSTHIIIICCFSFDGRRLGTSHYGGRQNGGTGGMQNNICLATVSVYTQVELVQLHNILVLMLWEQPPFVSWPKPPVRSWYLSLCNWNKLYLGLWSSVV